MRSVLALAVMLLALTLALNHGEALFRAQPPANGRADRALELVVGAKGPLLPAAEFGTGPERVGQVIRVGDRTLLGGGADGLRMARLGADHTVLAEGFYDVAHSRADEETLLEEIRATRAGEILVLASSGRLAPEGEEAPPQGLTRIVASLAAAADPGRSTPESWAFVARRQEGGWIPLAEGHSLDSGVALALVLAADPRGQGDPSADRVWFRGHERREVFLEEELSYASRRTSGVARARDVRIGDRPFDGILVPPVRNAAEEPAVGRLTWSRVQLSEGAGLVAWPGIADSSANRTWADFEVRVDGQSVERRRVEPGRIARPMEVDLRPFAGRVVELELVVETPGDAAGTPALWGRPMLVHGYDRSPLEVWAQER